VSKRVLSVFTLPLKPPGKLEPNFVGMLIGWFYKKSRFFVVDWKYKKEIKNPTFNGLKIDKGPYIYM